MGLQAKIFHNPSPVSVPRHHPSGISRKYTTGRRNWVSTDGALIQTVRNEVRLCRGVDQSYRILIMLDPTQIRIPPKLGCLSDLTTG